MKQTKTPTQPVISSNPKYPPSRTRGMTQPWKKGQSGNPKGGKIKDPVKWFRKELRKALLTKDDNGEKKLTQITEKFVDRLLADDMQDADRTRAMGLVKDSLDGRDAEPGKVAQRGMAAAGIVMIPVHANGSHPQHIVDANVVSSEPITDTDRQRLAPTTDTDRSDDDRSDDDDRKSNKDDTA